MGEESFRQSKQELLLGLKGPDSFKELKEGLHLFIHSSMYQTSTRRWLGARHRETEINKSSPDSLAIHTESHKMFTAFDSAIPLLGMYSKEKRRRMSTET